jgi:hypothetical protein
MFWVSPTLAVTFERTGFQTSGRRVRDIQIRLLSKSDEFRIWPGEEKDKANCSGGRLWC